jgi:hypothetical protein
LNSMGSAGFFEASNIWNSWETYSTRTKRRDDIRHNDSKPMFVWGLSKHYLVGVRTVILRNPRAPGKMFTQHRMVNLNIHCGTSDSEHLPIVFKPFQRL